MECKTVSHQCNIQQLLSVPSFCNLACEASVCVEVSALKSPFPSSGCARNGAHYVRIQNKEIGLLLQKPPRKRLPHFDFALPGTLLLHGLPRHPQITTQSTPTRVKKSLFCCFSEARWSAGSGAQHVGTYGNLISHSVVQRSSSVPCFTPKGPGPSCSNSG